MPIDVFLKYLRDDQVLWGECLSGALYWNDFENLARKVGFHDPRLVEDDVITVQNKKVQQVIAEASGWIGILFRHLSSVEIDRIGTSL